MKVLVYGMFEIDYEGGWPLPPVVMDIGDDLDQGLRTICDRYAAQNTEKYGYRRADYAMTADGRVFDLDENHYREIKPEHVEW